MRATLARLVGGLIVLGLAVVALFSLTALLGATALNVGPVEVGIFGVFALLVALGAAVWPDPRERD